VKRARAIVLLLTALSSSLATALPRPCAAQEPAPSSKEAAKEAEVHFRRGVELYKQGDSAGAIVEFHRAYELSPNYRVLYNVGQTYYQLQRYADAMKALRSFLSGGGSAIPAAKRAQVEADIRMLEAHVADVEVRVNADGAQIAVDDEAVGVSPLHDPVLVSIGRRKVSAVKGAQRVERFLDVATGDHASVVLELPPETPPPPPVVVPPPPPPTPPPTVNPIQPPPPPPEASSGGGSTIKWVLWGATGAFAVGTAVTGILTLTAQSNLSAQLNTFPGNSDQIDQTRNQGRALGLVTDGLIAATAVAGGLALWVTLTNHSSSAPKVDVRVGAGTVQLQGRFQ